MKESIENPKVLFVSLLSKIGFLIPDKLYLQLLYYLMVGRRLDLKNPQTFSEKIQWLKLHDRNPKYFMMVDKYAVKSHVAKIIGDKYIIPTLGVWNRPEDIDYDILPQKFVLKTTHGGGSFGIIICKDKSNFDVNEAIHRLKKAMKQDIYIWGREWAYKNVKPRVIAERFISDSNGELNDYKVFTFGGEPKMIELDFNRFKGHQRNLYDFDWNRIDAAIEYQPDPLKEFEKPEMLDELYDISKKLSHGFPFLRTDFYIVNKKIYFGELTFYPDSGFGKIQPSSFDLQMGKWLELPS